MHVYVIDANIKAFLQNYRSTLPTASITPKLHMLEDHVMPWVRRWKFGLGFHGEQGAESIHARFNSMQRTYASVRNATERLKAIVKEHNMSVLLYVAENRPEVKKRNTTNKD